MKKVIIDTNSLIHFIEFYQKMKNFQKVFDLICKKINNQELIILDKVRNEIIFASPEGKILKGLPFDKAVNTNFLLPEINKVDNWYLKERELGKKPGEIENLKTKFKEKDADAYLVLYCLYLKNNKENVILISDEHNSADNKLYMKLPKICEKEKIAYGHISDYLFNELKEEIKIGVID